MRPGKTPLDRLAEAYGIQLRYLSETKEWRAPSDEAKRAVLAAMGVDASNEYRIEAALARVTPLSVEDGVPPDDIRCFLPSWLAKGKCWGITCQLYGLRSARNHGIGDFEDLARLAELAASAGADMLGVNPLHALFTADPARCSPFSPSNRRFLNPMYIALDRIPGIDVNSAVDEAACAKLRAAARIDYAAVATLKLDALRALWRRIEEHPSSWNANARTGFESFVAAGGEPLRRHALFETLSHQMVADGCGAGWPTWPEPYRNSAGDAVKRFAKAHEKDVRFHLWLQWIADAQLNAASERARAAGMRIGLYLDLAVGNATDGSATWTDPELVVPGAHIGAPPDFLFEGGQDWGLAPMSPVTLRARDFAPFSHMLECTMRRAGAIRIDHAMSMTRLFWIPFGHSPADGCYVRYPMPDLMRAVSDRSHAHGTVVIGEDLGTVPEGFSKTMREARILSCRVLYFEHTRSGFRAASSFPRNALLSASTHDLPPLAAWWEAEDVDLFHDLGLTDAATARKRRRNRGDDRRMLFDRLRKEADRKAFAKSVPRETLCSGAKLTPDLAAAIHSYLGRTPCRILAVQFEDLCGAKAPVNVPGTHEEYPNWQMRAAVAVEDIASGDMWAAVTNAVSHERPRRI